MNIPLPSHFRKNDRELDKLNVITSMAVAIFLFIITAFLAFMSTDAGSKASFAIISLFSALTLILRIRTYRRIP